MEVTERRKLRGGQSNWIADDISPSLVDSLPTVPIEIVIIGAGVMGAMLAYRLTAIDREVALVDRRPPAYGSTAASTALVMWGADVPLTHLARQLGAHEASRRWRRVFRASRSLADWVEQNGIQCGWVERHELYLAGTLLNEMQLREESAARRAADLPSTFYEGEAIAERFGIAQRAALLSNCSYEVDPVALTRGLLKHARSRGATITFPADVLRIKRELNYIRLLFSDGRTIDARHVILATGYERAVLFLPKAFTVSSSYAIATAPNTAPLWRENAMIWEASSPYLYTRATTDGRIVAGGEDEDFDDATRRDGLIGVKAGTISAKLQSMTAVDSIAIDCAWAAAFGSSPDGLPAIGRVRGYDNLWLAAGFGGNGVTFAALAADIIGAEFAGKTDADANCFDPYRFGHSS